MEARNVVRLSGVVPPRSQSPIDLTSAAPFPWQESTATLKDAEDYGILEWVSAFVTDDMREEDPDSKSVELGFLVRPARHLAPALAAAPARLSARLFLYLTFHTSNSRVDRSSASSCSLTQAPSTSP